MAIKSVLQPNTRLVLQSVIDGFGGNASAPWTPNRLTGSAFSVNQISAGLSGSYDTATDVNKIYWSAPTSGTNAGGTVWSAWINGTAATLQLPNGLNAGAIWVSVDSGAYATAANAADVYTLFTGLSNTPHYVSVRCDPAYGNNNVYMNKAGGNVLTITGTGTYIDLPSTFAFAANTNSIFTANGAGVANVANFTPALSRNGAVSASNVSIVVLRGNFQKLVISLNGGGGGQWQSYVSVDGAAPTTYLSIASTGGAYAMSIAATPGIHTYYIWPSVGGHVFAAAGDATATAMLSVKQLHQYGDSITQGQGLIGDVDLLRICPTIGYAALTMGLAGLTSQTLDTALTSWLTVTPVTTNDSAIIAIGRNDNATGFTAPVIAAYNSIIAKLLAKGYNKIICRGVLPAGDLSTTFPALNTAISTIVTTLGNPKVTFMDTSTCPAYTTIANDLTHPDTAGYITVANYLQPKYAAAGL